MPIIYIALIFSYLILAVPVYSATITKSTSEGCGLELSGQIEPGDFDKFITAARSADMLDKRSSDEETMNSPDKALCLNSSGGVFIEGQNIAKFVHQNGIGTRIPAGAECYSACAYVFMAGRMLGNEIDGPYRYLNTLGQLGFHAPYLQLPKGKEYSGDEVSEFVRYQSEIIADFIDFANYTSPFDYSPTISLSLIAEMLWAKSDELVYIDSTEKAARWGVDLEGVAPVIISDAAAAIACQNFESWIADSPSEISEYVKVTSYQTAQIYQSNKRFGFVDTGGYAERHCLVELSTKPITDITICTVNGFNGMRLGDCMGKNDPYGILIPAYYALPPDTPIRSLGIAN